MGIMLLWEPCQIISMLRQSYNLFILGLQIQQWYDLVKNEWRNFFTFLRSPFSCTPNVLRAPTVVAKNFRQEWIKISSVNTDWDRVLLRANQSTWHLNVTSNVWRIVVVFLTMFVMEANCVNWIQRRKTTTFLSTKQVKNVIITNINLINR